MTGTGCHWFAVILTKVKAEDKSTTNSRLTQCPFNERPQTSADILLCKDRAACGPTTISLPCALWLSTLMERFKNVVPHSNFLALSGYNHIRNVDIVLWSVFTWIKVPRFCCPEMFFIIYVLYLLIALYLWYVLSRNREHYLLNLKSASFMDILWWFPRFLLILKFFHK